MFDIDAQGPTHTIKVNNTRRKEQLIVYIIIFIAMKIFLILCLFSIFNVTIPIDYTCNPRAPCGCSKQPVVFDIKIVGGEQVNMPHSWGWIASLRVDNIHRCGASLLSQWYVITAAHCVYDDISLSHLSLNFGIRNLSTIGQLRNVTEKYIHPLFNQSVTTNDLAILRLNKPINLIDSNISCICLPKLSDSNLQLEQYPPIGANLVAIGWGVTDFFQSLPSTILRQVILPSMASTAASCANIINDPVVQFCAGFLEGGKDTCKGDSGGPLMLFKDGRWELVGITSYGEICGSPGSAGVYTRIFYYDSYIQEIINSNGTYKPNLKQTNVDNNVRSNTETFYQKSKIEIVFIFVLTVYRKLFF
jgi:secreted trypsin-like serine protease